MAFLQLTQRLLYSIFSLGAHVRRPRPRPLYPYMNIMLAAPTLTSFSWS